MVVTGSPGDGLAESGIWACGGVGTDCGAARDCDAGGRAGTVGEVCRAATVVCGAGATWASAGMALRRRVRTVLEAARSRGAGWSRKVTVTRPILPNPSVDLTCS